MNDPRSEQNATEGVKNCQTVLLAEILFLVGSDARRGWLRVNSASGCNARIPRLQGSDINSNIGPKAHP